MAVRSKRVDTTTAALQAEVEILRESVADLELALDDEGWARLSASSQDEFSRVGLGKAATIARTMAVANPLIKRGLNVRQAYVWGQGCTIQARDPKVNEIIQAFCDDPGTRESLTGDQAQEQLERTLGTDGNVFIVCFTNPRTGFVQPRTLPFDEIQDIITNPDDKNDPWLYKRVWKQRIASLEEGETVLREVEKTAYYPALNFRPPARPKNVNGDPIFWDAPVKHIKVNALDGWAFGIGDAYAALSWARAYRDFLADWAILVKALSQFAWKATSKGSRGQKLREALARRPAGSPTGNENTVGATAVMAPDVSLEAIPKSGATIDSESGKPLAAMVASGLDIPVTVLLGDPGQSGARAVAETLEWPTMLAMMQRQSLWVNGYGDITEYVIRKAVTAPQGPLKGTLTRDPYSEREVLALAGGGDPAVDIVFPPLDEMPLGILVDAITKADATMKLPPLEIVRLLLRAFKVDDADKIIEDMTDDDGNWINPYAEELANAARRFSRGDADPGAGQAAADAARRGEDPAGVV